MNPIPRSFVAAALCAALALGAVGSRAQDVWTRQSAFPTDRNPSAVYTISADRAIFVGMNRMIVETTNKGASWIVRGLSDFGTDPYYMVHFATPTLGFITGNNEMLRTNDGGASWSPIPFFGGSWSHIDFVSPTVGFVGANGACAKTTDGGQTWTLQSGYPTCPVMYGMDFRDANVGLVGGNMAGTTTIGIFKTSDGGRTWTLKDAEPANDVLWMSSTRAIADKGTSIRETLDAGETWQVIAGGITSGLVSLTRAGTGSLVIGVSGKGDVWRSVDGGFSWSMTFDGPGALPGIWEVSFSDASHGWIVGPGGFYYYSADGGVTWVQKNSGCNAQVQDLQMLTPTYGLAVGHDGYLFRTANGGAFWEVQKLEVTGQIWGRDEDLVAVDIVDEQFAAAAGPGGTVFKTEDGGVTWTSIGFPMISGNLWIYDVDFVDHQLGYVYGVDWDPPHTRTLLRTRNGGLSWEWVYLGERGGGTTVQFVDSQYGWLTADNDFGLRTTDGGSTWTGFFLPSYFTGPEVSKVRFLNRNVGWAVGWWGYLAKTTNGGTSWTLLDLNTIEDDLFDVIPVSDTEIWLCGREDFSFRGVVYRSTNGGQSWSRQVVTDWFYYPYRFTALPTGDAWFGGANGTIFRRQVPLTTLNPGSFAVFPGILVGGVLSDLFLSDDRYVSAQVDLAAEFVDDPITIRFEAVSPTASPGRLEFLAETRASEPGIRQTIELWNFAQSRWEAVHSSMTPVVDTAVTGVAGGALSRFVEPGTRKVRARIGWRQEIAESVSLWRTFTDRAVWRIGN